MQGCKEAGIPAFGTLWDFVSHSVFARLRRVFEVDCYPVNTPLCEARPLHARCFIFLFFSFPKL